MNRRRFLKMAGVLGVTLALPRARAAGAPSRPASFSRPPRLRRGDRISLIAPSSSFNRERFEKAAGRLAKRYRPSWSPDIFSQEEPIRFAGSDERRLRELHEALEGPSRAIICARGGYGAARLLPKLTLPKREKPLVGLSDVTALHAALQRAGRVSIHGPTVSAISRMEEDDFLHLLELLENPRYRPRLMGRPIVEARPVEGRVLGGNFSVFARLIGTPHLPPLDGAILFLEDIDENPYRLDRLWQQLALSGALGRLAGLAFGDWVDSGDADTTMERLAREAGLPCVAGLPCGHRRRNLAFALGARARLDTTNGVLEFLEGAVS